MVGQKKKYEAGAATAYIPRNQALKKLQLPLKDFRRLCILKGVYPVEPKHRKTAGHGSTQAKTFYFTKDIQYLLHEPIIHKLREFRVYNRKLKKAVNKRDSDTAKRWRKNKPKYTLDRLVKERYPSLEDALRDLDDALSLCFLFATFPKTKKTPELMTRSCQRRSVEFMHYVIASQSLRKVFISIKGVYFEALIHNETIRWVVPHKHSYAHEDAVDVDYRIMATFVEFYMCALGFVNCALYHELGLNYPPKLRLSEDDTEDDEDMLDERLSALTQTLQTVGDRPDLEEDDQPTELMEEDQLDAAKLEEQKVKDLKSLFRGQKFFLARETPREMLTFVIRCFGGLVSWECTGVPGATYQEEDETITHQIVDRPDTEQLYITRSYVQPQWVFDCVNSRRLLPVRDYLVGATLPPHVSPFVIETEGDYIPPERRKQLGLPLLETDDAEASSDEEISGLEEVKEESIKEKPKVEKVPTSKQKLTSVEDDEKKYKKPKIGNVKRGQAEKLDETRQSQMLAAEERRLAEVMIPKKQKKLYEKMVYSRKRKAKEAKLLKEKRETFEKEERKRRKLSKK